MISARVSPLGRGKPKQESLRIPGHAKLASKRGPFLPDRMWFLASSVPPRLRHTVFREIFLHRYMPLAQAHWVLDSVLIRQLRMPAGDADGENVWPNQVDLKADK